MNDYILLALLLTALLSLFLLPSFFSKLKLKYLLPFLKSDDKNGYVYIISNKAFKDDIVKIGMTNRANYKKRLGELFNTSVPYPFNVEYIFPHSDPRTLEKELHSYFSSKRLNTRREFFLIDKKTLKKDLISFGLLT